MRSEGRLRILLLGLALAGSSVSGVSAQCAESVERTPLRFSEDGSRVLVEVVKRDDCFPDGIGSHSMEIRDTEELHLIERTELARGERDWSDPSTWEPRDARAEILRRRGEYLQEHGERFPIEVMRRITHWASGAIVLGDLELSPPAGLAALMSPYENELDVEVWLPRSRTLRVAVGTVLHAGRDRLVVLRHAA